MHACAKNTSRLDQLSSRLFHGFRHSSRLLYFFFLFFLCFFSPFSAYPTHLTPINDSGRDRNAISRAKCFLASVTVDQVSSRFDSIRFDPIRSDPIRVDELHNTFELFFLKNYSFEKNRFKFCEKIKI